MCVCYCTSGHAQPYDHLQLCLVVFMSKDRSSLHIVVATLMPGELTVRTTVAWCFGARTDAPSTLSPQLHLLTARPGSCPGCAPPTPDRQIAAAAMATPWHSPSNTRTPAQQASFLMLTRCVTWPTGCKTPTRTVAGSCGQAGRLACTKALIGIHTRAVAWAVGLDEAVLAEHSVIITPPSQMPLPGVCR